MPRPGLGVSPTSGHPKILVTHTLIQYELPYCMYLRLANSVILIGQSMIQSPTFSSGRVLSFVYLSLQIQYGLEPEKRNKMNRIE